jgi:protein TonB
MARALPNLRPEQWIGLILVLALHAAALYGLWRAKLIPAPTEAATVFVNFINPPAPPKPKEPPKPKLPVVKPVPVKLDTPRPPEPQHAHLVTQAPVTAPTDVVEPPPPVVVAPTPQPPAPPAPPPKPAGPVNLSTELSVSCTDRPPPVYPALARRMGEEGKVVLRVELGEDGRIAQATVATSSGSGRLDQAALAAIKNWRCNAAQRDGHAVRAVAMQPFNFILEGQ